MRSGFPRRRGASAIISICAGGLLLAFPLAASGSVYPAGGGAFATGAEGWAASEESCNIPLGGACSAGGGYDAGAGNPPGSLAAEATILVNLGGLFEASVVLTSPDFSPAETGAATLALDRRFEPGGLLTLAPEAAYTVDLIDRTAETSAGLLTETLDEGDSAFAPASAGATLTAGHTYALAIEVEVGSTSPSLGLLGAAVADFDNVSLTTEAGSGEEGEGGGEQEGEGEVGPGGPGEAPSGGAGGEGGAGGPGGQGGASGADASTAGRSTLTGALTADVLRRMVRRGDPHNARLRGRRIFVRLRCPGRAERFCTITAQGRLGNRVAVTRRRTVRIGKGRNRLVALRVRRRFRRRLAHRRRLLVVQRVRVGKVSTTFARSRTLLRRR